MFSLPRIRFNFHPPNSSWTADRLQFPLRLAYAATFHSCLGLTLDRAGLDFRTDIFAHGQLYTGISRIRTRHDGLAIVAEETQEDTKNVVYAELLN
jgi:ATP-dependent exoDNAse (exonuclease V) alpha subunit